MVVFGAYIVGVLNDQDDYHKNRNYWKYLKTKLKSENNEVVSGTNQLKLLAPDGKHRLADVLDYDGVLLLAKSFPNARAMRFVEWFTNSDETIDGKSKSKAYALFESSLIDNMSRACNRYMPISLEVYTTLPAKYVQRQ